MCSSVLGCAEQIARGISHHGSFRLAAVPSSGETVENTFMRSGIYFEDVSAIIRSRACRGAINILLRIRPGETGWRETVPSVTVETVNPVLLARRTELKDCAGAVSAARLRATVDVAL